MEMLFLQMVELEQDILMEWVDIIKVLMATEEKAVQAVMDLKAENKESGVSLHLKLH